MNLKTEAGPTGANRENRGEKIFPRNAAMDFVPSCPHQPQALLTLFAPVQNPIRSFA